ncbi:hypothetical protein BG011_008232 [Mortierella polycephala]|uniref:Uncharacterized protein n=1 Tax=Mortierella polycephala TaxID=41804 RepID=A0A9P6QDS0_9FUNG|nr:hypothetical protein BG011_008232 [Mortierella polycephala]
MLAFGLTVIVLFIRLHGDGYDFPVQVAKCRDELEFQRPPDRTYMEISGVYHDDFRDWNREHDLDYKDEDENTGVHGYDHVGSEGVEHTRAGHGSGSRNMPEGRGDNSASNSGRNTQWHLGKKKKTTEGDDVSETRDPGAQGTGDLNHGHAPDDDQWIWMTNIWHDDGDCGPGHLRQYRRRLAHVLTSDNSSSWELMYTHRFPGFITHSSLSKRVVPEQAMDDHLENKNGKMIPRPRGRESIRLAVVYKIVQDEHASYRSRIYHFGTFQNHEDLKVCKERKKAPYRMSYLTAVAPSAESDDVHVMMGQVHQYRDNWEYQLSIATEASEVMSGHKKWLTDPQWPTRQYQSQVQENDMINDEPVVYGVSVQTPFFVKSVDGSSIHIPIKNVIKSLETKRLPYLEDILSEMDSFDPERAQSIRELVGHQHPHHAPSSTDQRSRKVKMGTEHYVIPSPSLKEKWIESHIDVGSLDSIDTEQGAINDATDIMALKTTEVLAMTIIRVPLPAQEEPREEEQSMNAKNENDLGQLSRTEAQDMDEAHDTLPPTLHNSEPPTRNILCK